MVRPIGAGGIAHAHSNLHTRVVHRELHALDCQVIRLVRDFPSMGEPCYPLRQEISEALSFCDHLKQSNDQIRIAEPKLQPVRVRLCDHAFLEAFASKGDH